jgi:hypothetical protein
MKSFNYKLFLLNKEVWIQTVFWVFFFAAINVNWSQTWISHSFLPASVAPHIAIAVAVIFFLNTYWLIPKYLNKKKWLHYIWLSFSLLLSFEIIRTVIFSLVLQGSNSFVITFKNEFFGENSLLFGFLNVLIFHVIFYSFVYRFTRDWLINKSIIETLKFEKNELQIHAMQLAGDIGVLQNSKESLNVNTQEIKSVKNTLTVKKKDGTFLLKIEDIIYFQAQGDFVFAFYNTNNKHIINESLKSIKGQVCPDSFFQINRSELVSFNYITKFKSYTKNRLEMSLLNSNHILYTSNSKAPIFRDWIDSH